MTEPWLLELERRLAEDERGDELPTVVVTLAALAGRDVPLDEDEVNAATRRALFVLAAGGDPARGLDLNGSAVTRLADDLADDERRAALARGLNALRAGTAGLPHLSETVHALIDAPETAWRAYACSLLAEELAE